MQHHLHFFSVSQRTWIATLRIQWFLRRMIKIVIPPGCVSIFFLRLAICQFPFLSSQWLFWRKVTNGKCGSSFVYNYWGQFNFKRASVFHGSDSRAVTLVRIIFFLTCKVDHIAGWHLLFLYSMYFFFLILLQKKPPWLSCLLIKITSCQWFMSL